jgi:hypothetical protein
MQCLRQCRFFDANQEFVAIQATDPVSRTRGYVGIICMDTAGGFFQFDAEL